MTDAGGPQRPKRAWDWPVMSRAQAVNDNPSPSAQMELIVFGCAIAVVCLLAGFHSALGF
jgi:hypothetical protein